LAETKDVVAGWMVIDVDSYERADELAGELSAAIACDLIAWLQILALDGDLATAEPKRLRYCFLHTAARLTHGQRRRWLRIPHHLAPGPTRSPPRSHGPRPSGLDWQNIGR
jgi:hypothetical protein